MRLFKNILNCLPLANINVIFAPKNIRKAEDYAFVRIEDR